MGKKKSFIKSPLRYPGGKSLAAKTLCGMLPSCAEYREPFVGGGSVFITAKQMDLAERYVINDLDLGVSSFWGSIASNHRHTIDRIQAMYNVYKEGNISGKALYKTCLTYMDNKMGRDTRAMAFFILNRITFSGTISSGGFSQQAYDRRFTQSSIDRLRKVVPVVNGVKVYNNSYMDFLKSPCLYGSVSIYLDPPYYSNKDSRLYGKNGNLHTGFNHDALALHLGNCKHNWLMTYDDCEYIRDTYSDYYIQSFSIQYGMNNVGGKSAKPGSELIISNYKIGET